MYGEGEESVVYQFCCRIIAQRCCKYILYNKKGTVKSLVYLDGIIRSREYRVDTVFEGLTFSIYNMNISLTNQIRNHNLNGGDEGMNIVNYSEAARVANVSRQAIHLLKKAHLAMIRHYPFFCQDPKTKKTGVDIDNPDWKLYVDRNSSNVLKKKRSPKKTKPKVVKSDKKNDAYITDMFFELMKIVEETIIETIDPAEEELNNFKKLCIKKSQVVIK